MVTSLPKPTNKFEKYVGKYIRFEEDGLENSMPVWKHEEKSLFYHFRGLFIIIA